MSLHNTISIYDKKQLSQINVKFYLFWHKLVGFAPHTFLIFLQKKQQKIGWYFGSYLFACIVLDCDNIYFYIKIFGKKQIVQFEVFGYTMVISMVLIAGQMETVIKKTAVIFDC